MTRHADGLKYLYRPKETMTAFTLKSPGARYSLRPTNTETHTHMSFIQPWHTDRETRNSCGILIIIQGNITYIKFNRFDIFRFCV